MADQVAGTVLMERYALEDRIGVGGMASVYRAIDLTTGKRVAVKILSRDFLAKNSKEAERNVKRFRREAEILRLLVGETYIVQFIEQGVSPAGDHFIAMELLEGEQLRFHIGRGKAAMKLRTFAYYAKHLIRGLMGIHARNLIHRDLAPDNIVIVKTREGLPWPKFLDFGIGKSLEGDLDQVTQMLTIMGKPQYFSPEQARGQELDFKSDVYALGVLLYEMVTGFVPLEIHGIADLRRIQKDPAPSITRYREGCRIPEDLQAVIMQCLEKDPEARPNLEQVLAVVERFSDRLDAGEEFPLPATGLDPTAAMPRPADSSTSHSIPAAGVPGEFSPGETIGRFQVRERIGRGGMGLVYLAWDPILLREVAIKVATRVEGEKARRAILREARASSHLKSENIVTIYDAGIEAGSPYIAMEYVRGKTLAQIIDEEGALPPERFARIARGILDGLVYAHEGETPVIHRDLKPANILCAGEIAKIADFGIATVTAAQHLTTNARDATTGGTGAEGSVFTISPEQANNKPADHRSDIYALGCILYMMSTGRAPFRGNQIAILYQHVTKQPEPPIKVNPALTPPGLNAIILKCLEKDPANRYQSVREVRAEIDQLFGAASVVRPWHRSPVVLTSLAAIAITGIAIAFALYGRRGPVAARMLTVTQVTGIPFHNDQKTYLTNAKSLDVEVATPTAGELRASVSAPWLDPPSVQRFPLRTSSSQTVKIILPDARGPEPANLTVMLDRPDNPDQQPVTFTLIQDLVEPKVRFRAYGVPHERSTSPIRVVRIRDLEAEIDDLGGFDEEGKIKHLDVGWNDNPYNASFTRKVKEGHPGLVWTAIAKARDRADNRTEIPQLVEVVPLDVDVRAPLEGHAQNDRTIHVELVGRLLDRTQKVPGLDENDLDLGPGAFEARVALGGKPHPTVAMKRTSGAYAADVEIPSEATKETDLDLEILFEGEVIKRVRQRFDTVGPVITVECGGEQVSSANAYAARPTLFVDVLESRSSAVRCRISEVAAGPSPPTVDVRLDGKAPVRVAVEGDGTFQLPPMDAGEFEVRVEGRDEAGNLAVVDFRVVRKGLQITSVRVGGAEPDAEGRVFVKDDRIPIRLAAIGVPDSENAFAVLFDDRGAERASVRLDRVDGEPNFFEGRDLRVFPQGADRVELKLKILFGKTAATARSFSHDLAVVYDREPPAILVTFEGSEEEVGDHRTVGRFPPLKVRLTDNVALVEEPTAVAITWTRADHAVPDVVLEPDPVPASRSSYGPTLLTYTIDPPPGTLFPNRFEFSIRARDRTPREPVRRSFVVEVVPTDVAILSVADQSGFAQFGESAARPLLLNRENVAVSIRPPRSPCACTLAIKAFPEGGTEVVRRFPLDGSEGVPKVDFVVALPKAADARLIEHGRLVFLLEETGTARADELATVYYLLDRDLPSWEVTRNARTLTEAERLDWIKAAALSSIRIVVSDGRGSGFNDHWIEDPAGVVGSVEEQSPDRVVFSLKDDESFRGPATRELELRVRDAAGNVATIRLKLARSKELFEVKRVLTAEGQEPILSGDVLVVNDPELRFVIDNDAVGLQGVQWVVKRGDREIKKDFVELPDEPPGGSVVATWLAADRAEPYSVELYAYGPKGVETEPFHRVRVLVDTAAPSIYLRVGDHPIGSSERARIKDFGELRLEISDDGADVDHEFTSVHILADGGRRLNATVAPSRDGRVYRIIPSETLAEGIYTVRVAARDRYRNAETKIFDVEVSERAVASSALVQSTATTRATTRPDPENVRTIANQAIREKDEERTGLKLMPVWETPDRSGPPRFFMSQTEVTNAQFLRFVDALAKDQIPPDLRWRPDLSSTKKSVENMRSRFDDFRRAPTLPLVEVESEVAFAYAAWTGGRLPSRDEWVRAAGRFLVKDALYPVYLDHGTPKSSEFWMRDPSFANFQRGTREARRQPVTELLRYQAVAPFGIVGFAGNVAEWVTYEPGGRKVFGTMGGSFKYPYTNEVNSPRLDREPRMSASDAGIRVFWPANPRSQ
jgi:serine/threonine protein kinase